jgi:hypothetical protein
MSGWFNWVDVHPFRSFYSLCIFPAEHVQELLFANQAVFIFVNAFEEFPDLCFGVLLIL